MIPRRRRPPQHPFPPCQRRPSVLPTGVIRESSAADKLIGFSFWPSLWALRAASAKIVHRRSPGCLVLSQTRLSLLHARIPSSLRAEPEISSHGSSPDQRPGLPSSPVAHISTKKTAEILILALASPSIPISSSLVTRSCQLVRAPTSGLLDAVWRARSASIPADSAKSRPPVINRPAAR